MRKVYLSFFGGFIQAKANSIPRHSLAYKTLNLIEEGNGRSERGGVVVHFKHLVL